MKSSKEAIKTLAAITGTGFAFFAAMPSVLADGILPNLGQLVHSIPTNAIVAPVSPKPISLKNSIVAGLLGGKTSGPIKSLSLAPYSFLFSPGGSFYHSQPGLGWMTMTLHNAEVGMQTTGIPSNPLVPEAILGPSTSVEPGWVELDFSTVATTVLVDVTVAGNSVNQFTIHGQGIPSMMAGNETINPVYNPATNTSDIEFLVQIPPANGGYEFITVSCPSNEFDFVSAEITPGN